MLNSKVVFRPKVYRMLLHDKYTLGAQKKDLAPSAESLGNTLLLSRLGWT